MLSESYAIDFAGKSTDVRRNESLVDQSFTNRSEETKASSSNKLMTILKYKLDITNSENVRLITEAEILKKELVEATKNNVNAERPAVEINIVSALKYEELMRKVETINGITDSNRLLREERDALNAQVVSLTKRLNKDDLLPLQETNRELTVKINEQTSENQSLRNIADLLQKRCNNLVDRSQKNAKEFKRLQTECENLATKLAAEKEAIREKKESQDVDLSTVLNNCQAHLLEKTKISDELIALKAVQQNTATEIMQLKSAVIQKEDDIKKVTDDLAAAEAEVTSSKGKEMQVRKIAKRYKDAVSVQSAKIEELEAVIASKPLPEEIAALAEAERIASAHTSALTAQITALQDELDQQRRENENLKKNMHEGQVRIKSLTEVNAALHSLEQMRFVASQKSQLDRRTIRLENMAEEDISNKEVIARRTSENGTLSLRANQRNVQKQQHQDSKPSTSSVTIKRKPSAVITLRRCGDTPLASIRPMSVQKNRTAAVLPTLQTSNVDDMQGLVLGSVTDDRDVLQQQPVVFDTPVVEVIPQNELVPQQQSPHQVVLDQNREASTSSGAGTTISTTYTASSSSAGIRPRYQASSTTQAVEHKRQHVGDSTSVKSENETPPTIKRARFGESVSNSGLDVDYQVPTSSRRDEEDTNVNIKNSEEEDDEESCDTESSSDPEQEDKSEDIDEKNPQHDNSEVDDSSGAPSHEQRMVTSPQKQETPQNQAITSDSEARSSTWHGDICQQELEENADDIMPSTSALYVPQRPDGLAYTNHHQRLYSYNFWKFSASPKLLKRFNLQTNL